MELLLTLSTETVCILDVVPTRNKSFSVKLCLWKGITNMVATTIDWI